MAKDFWDENKPKKDEDDVFMDSIKNELNEIMKIKFE